MENFKNWVRNEIKPPGKIYKAISDIGVKAGLDNFEEMRFNPDAKLRSNALNIVVYILLKEGKITESLEVFKKNLEVFSEEIDVYDSYAESLVVLGNLAESKIYYQKTLEKNSNNQNISEILKHFK